MDLPALDRELFENVLLGLLLESPAHGYQLVAHFRPGGDLGGVARLGKSQLYALLNSLEQGGLAGSSLQPESGGPARKVYAITGAGEERFHSWLRQPVPTLRRLRLEFMFKLYFYRRLSLPGASELLRAQEELLGGIRDELGGIKGRQDDLTTHLIGLRKHLLGAALEWLAEETRAHRAGPEMEPEEAGP